MKLIYVAGKYTGKTYSEIDDNIFKAEMASIKLLRLGWAVITPHKNTAHYERYEDDNLTYETWIALDLEILKRCDAIFLMRDWEASKGAVQEHEFALENKIEVYQEINVIPRPENHPENLKEEDK